MNGLCWVEVIALASHRHPLALNARRYVVSNLRLTYMLVRGCRAAGVPSYGAIWDS